MIDLGVVVIVFDNLRFEKVKIMRMNKVTMNYVILDTFTQALCFMSSNIVYCWCVLVLSSVTLF